MSELVVVGYNSLYQAQEVRLALLKLQEEHLIDLDDAVVAEKTTDGQVKLHQAVSLPAAGALSGGLWGSLIGLLFLSPLLGAAVGAASGAAAGALTDIGISDDFMKSLAATLQPGTSALFILIRKITPDKVLAEVGKYGGTVLKTSLSNEDEVKLQAALDAAKSEVTAPPPTSRTPLPPTEVPTA